jgi:multiple sugar transport system ATP-binding protein
MNLMRARVARSGETVVVRCGPLEVAIADRPAVAAYEGREVVLGIRPEDLEDARFGPPGAPRLPALVELREDLGRETHLHFTLDAPPAVMDETRELRADGDAILAESLEREAQERRTRVVARVDARARAAPGDLVELAVDPGLLAYFDLETGLAI